MQIYSRINYTNSKLFVGRDMLKITKNYPPKTTNLAQAIGVSNDSTVFHFDDSAGTMGKIVVVGHNEQRLVIGLG